MKWAVLTLTKGALSKGKIIKEKVLGVDLYTLSKWADDESIEIKGKFGDFVGEIFNKYDTILFIMATGIVVRVISKYIQHKAIDPAILVMDEGGQHVISLLSGHLGGGNEATKYIADILGATPVITTASDVKNTIAVDTLAMKLNCEIESLEDAKKVTSLIVNDEVVGIESQVEIPVILPNNIVHISKDRKIKGLICISNRKDFKSSLDKDIKVKLIPKNIIIGIGCKKGVPKERIINAIDNALDKLNIYKESIKVLSTIDIKKDEIGIIEASKHYDIPLEIIDKEELVKVEENFKTSDFVKKSIGVGAVCEPCGYISSNFGKCLMGKTAFNGITLSIWEEELNE